MFIVTSTENTCTIFDTQTVTRYSLQWDDHERHLAYGVYLFIDTPNSPRDGDYDTPGLAYSGQEAIDFWREFQCCLSGVSDDNKKIVFKAGDVAQSVLDQINERETEMKEAGLEPGFDEPPF